MAYQISFKPSAAKEIKKLDRQTAKRIMQAIEKLRDEPRPRGAIMLENSGGAMRIRVGDYRIVYDINDAEIMVLVLKVGHRREVYAR